MKKQAGIILLAIALAAVLCPRRDIDSHTIDEGSGPLQLSGYSMRVPIIQPVRIGTWRAHYAGGGLGKEIDYSFGSQLAYREYYPNGKLRFAGSYSEDQRHGDWSMHSENGRLISQITYSKGVVTEQRLFGDGGELIFHEKDGRVLVDMLHEYINKKKPNHAMEPTPVNVTFPACAGTAPFTSVAHLGR